MEIKFGNITLNDWQVSPIDNRIYHRTCNDTGLSRVTFMDDGEWFVQFDYELSFMGGLFSPSPAINTEDAMKQVDDFLILMSKLTAFI